MWSLWYDLCNCNAKLDLWPQFCDSLNIENDSVSGAFVYDGHILVYFYMGNDGIPDWKIKSFNRTYIRKSFSCCYCSKAFLVVMVQKL